MTDIKISQLASVTSLSNTDLLPVSKSLGGGNWESNSITAKNVLSSLGSARLLIVATEGVRNASTIKDAISQAIVLAPTQANPVVIQVRPGSYPEDNPINIPEWVSIYGTGSYGTIVVALNDGDIFVGNGNSAVGELTIYSLPSHSNNTAYKSTTTTTGILTRCVLINCHNGVLADNGSINANFIIGISLGGSLDKLISAINGGYILATSCVATGGNCAFYSYGTGTELYLYSCEATGCVNGMCANNNGYVDAFSNHYDSCDSAIHIGSTGSSHIKAEGSIIQNSITNDLFIESSTGHFDYMGHIDSSKFSVVNDAIVNIVASDENTEGGLVTGTASLQGKTSIGTPGAIFLQEDMQVNIGEGSAFVNDKQGNEIVEYWSFDASGSTFTRFANNAGTQLTNSGDAIYVGCKYPFPAIRLDVNVAVVLGSADFVTEYWDGSNWKLITVAGYKRSNFARRANVIFQNVETQFVDFSNALFNNNDWADAINVPNEIPNWDAGQSFYAIRFRNSGALTSGMQFGNGMVKPHSFMVSTSGYKANFGVYRTEDILYVDSSNFTAHPTYPTSFTNIQVSANITYSQQPSFTKTNANPDKITQASVAFTLPSNIGTASPLLLYVDGVASTADTGNIVTTIYVARLDATNPPTSFPIPDTEVGPEITAVPGILNGFMAVYQEIDISGYNPGDTLFVSFARQPNDASDTYVGDFIVGDMTFKYSSKFV